MKRLSVLLAILLGAFVTSSAQTEKDLRRYFEGKQVRTRIAMPATKDGVNIYPEREQSFDYQEYEIRVKQHGVSAGRDERVGISRINVKDRHIEVRLERTDSNAGQKDTGQHASRFNIHFRRIDPLILSPQVIVAALRRYVEFSDEDLALLNETNQPYAMADYRKCGVVRVGQSTTFLKNGLSTSEVVSLLGAPSAVYSRDERGVRVTTYEFKRSGEKIVIADFVGKALVQSRTELCTPVVRSEVDYR